MASTKIYNEDLVVAQSLLKRDGNITRKYLYQQCYPLFKSIFDNYHTDCETVFEFINEIYILILTPGKQSGRCQLENYRGESSLATWLKTACLFYCYDKYDNKKKIPVVDMPYEKNDEDDEDAGDRLLENASSITMDFTSMYRSDLDAILAMMPNERYRTIIRLRYLENRSNEETAELMEMTMANYYNKHKLAKAQFIKMLKKEEQI